MNDREGLVVREEEEKEKIVSDKSENDGKLCKFCGKGFLSRSSLCKHYLKCSAKVELTNVR